MATGSIACPFCGETILATAKKCKHCGEWLEQASDRAGSKAGSKGTADARAVAKGIKQKEADDMTFGCGCITAAIASTLIGMLLTWWVGLILFIGLTCLLSVRYNKE